MNIWVDADACPVPVKNIIFKAAERLQIPTTLLANHPISTPPSKVIKSKQVQAGFDVADNEILALMSAGDVIVIQDVPLAAEIVAKGGVAINPRGTLYTPDNMHEHLVRRNRAEEMRAMGFQGSGAEPFGKKHAQAFANSFDKVLAQGSR